MHWILQLHLQEMESSDYKVASLTTIVFILFLNGQKHELGCRSSRIEPKYSHCPWASSLQWDDIRFWSNIGYVHSNALEQVDHFHTSKQATIALIVSCSKLSAFKRWAAAFQHLSSFEKCVYCDQLSFRERAALNCKMSECSQPAKAMKRHWRSYHLLSCIS